MTDPTRFVDDSTVVTREAETNTLSPDVDWAGGLNQGGANSPGIGVGVGTPLVEDASQWTRLDQDGGVRQPQVSQHLGSTGLGDGASGKGLEGLGVVTNDVGGQGEVTQTGDAFLIAVGTGWQSI